GAQGMQAAGVLDGHVAHAPLVDECAQLQVDLARRQPFGVEHGAIAVDLGDVGHRAVELDEPARVVLRLGRTHRDHTRAWPSSGSNVVISWSMTREIAISSDASAMTSSDS